MGGIPDSLIRDFVKIAKEPVKSGGDSTLYGTVTNVTGSGANREAAVRIDGADIDTPASLGMDAEQGDRVSILMKNHEAIINGNITSPASARTATKYMRFTDEGLKIGSFGEASSPSGNYILITDNAYYIKTSDDVTLLSVTSDGTRVYGLDGKIKASFLSDGTRVYDPTGTKTEATFLSDGIKIYNQNGGLTSAFDASGVRLFNATDGVRIYADSSGTAAKLLASFISTGIRLHTLVDNNGTTVNRTLAEFLASGLRFYNQNGVLKMLLDGDGIKLYKDANNYAANFTSTGTRLFNQNGKRTFIANGDGVTLYDNDEIPTASFTGNGLVLYGKRDGVRIYDAPTSTDPNAPHTAQLLASFISTGIRLHTITSSGANVTTAAFLSDGIRLYDLNGNIQQLINADGIKLYNKNGNLTAEFNDNGLKLYGLSDGVRIYNNSSAKKLLASFKSDGVRLHTIKDDGTNVTTVAVLKDTINLYNPDGVIQQKIDANGLKLYNKLGNHVTAELDDYGLKLYGLSDGVRIYNSQTGQKLLASFKSDGIRLHTIVASGDTTVSRTVAEFLSTGIGFKRSNGTKSMDIGGSDVTLYDSTGQNPVSVRSALDGLQNQHDMLRTEMVNNYALQSDLSDLEDEVDGKASQSSVDTLTNNLNTLLMQLTTLTETGTVTVTASAAANAITLFRGSANVPSGYTLTGIRDIVIKNSNGDRNVHYSLHQFATLDNGMVQVHVHNDTSSAATLTVDIEWFAIRTSFSLS